MCGLFGLVNGKKNRTASGAICKLVADGIMVNSLRGFDSTGVFQADKDSVYAHRVIGDGIKFAKSKTGFNYTNDSDTAFFTVVHNRAATEGSVTLDNCHPFEHLDEASTRYTVGVHNGTLTNWRGPKTEFDVDSDWAMSRINAVGNDAFKEFAGAYCFIWHNDDAPNILNIARNSQRPLFFMYVKDTDRMIFASEYQMVTWIAERNGVELEPEIYNLSPNYIYAFNVDNPREFTRTATPNYVYNNSGMEERNRDKYISDLEAIIAGSKRGKAAKGKETSTALVQQRIDELEAEAHSNAVSAVDTTVSSAMKAIPLVSIQELNCAKAMEFYRKEVVFEMMCYDETKQELWGVVAVEDDTFSALIRRVNKSTYDTWKIASKLTCNVLGIMVTDAVVGAESGAKDVTLILSRNVRVDSVVAEYAAEEGEPSELSSALAASITAHFADKEAKEIIHDLAAKI